MKIRFLVVASLFAMPVSAVQDRCKPMDVMMGVFKAKPVKPEGASKAILLPKAQIESTGPAVLRPSCKKAEPKRRRKNDFPLA